MPTVLITGANRGLGLEFARQYAADGWRVIAAVRDPATAERIEGDVRVEALDMTDRAALAGFGNQLGDAPVDLVIANAGVMGPGAVKSAADGGGWLETLAVNSVAPTLLAQAVLPNVAKARGKLVAITSEMGSIEGNASGGYIAYRSSKAALNAAWRGLSIDHKDEPVVFAMLHPGWVQTDMGGRNAAITPEQSVTGLRRVIDGLTPAQSGAFLNYRGETLAW